MTSVRAPLAALSSPAIVSVLALALHIPASNAAGPPCPPPVAYHSHDCPRTILAPRGLPSHGGTITVHPGIPAPCVVSLPGGVLLCAGGETALLPSNQHGRAIFRVSGTDWSDPGGVNIVVSAAPIDSDRAPEVLPALNADAVVRVPPHAVLLRFVPATGQFVPVPDGHIRQATLYKLVRRGASPALRPAPPALPSTLPATGSSPIGAMLALAACLLAAGLWLGRGIFATLLPISRPHGWQPYSRPRGREPARSSARTQGQAAADEGKATPRPTSARTRLGAALLVGGVVLAGAAGLTYATLSAAPAPAGFGALTADGGRGVGGGASGPPTRLAIPRLGIDTPIVTLDIVGGAWQVPSFAAGYLAGGAWPGHDGNEIITGHDDQDGAVFRPLGNLRPGDVVIVYAGARTYRYAVTALRVVPTTRTDLLRPTRGATLTLITCTPYLIDTERLVARARLLS